MCLATDLGEMAWTTQLDWHWPLEATGMNHVEFELLLAFNRQLDCNVAPHPPPKLLTRIQFVFKSWPAVAGQMLIFSKGWPAMASLGQPWPTMAYQGQR